MNFNIDKNAEEIDFGNAEIIDEGLTVTDISDLNIGNVDEMSTEELEKLFSRIDGTPCKIITLENADEFLSDIKVTPNGTMLFPQGN